MPDFCNFKLNKGFGMNIHFLLLREHYRLQKGNSPPDGDYFFVLGMIANFREETENGVTAVLKTH